MKRWTANLTFFTALTLHSEPVIICLQLIFCGTPWEITVNPHRIAFYLVGRVQRQFSAGQIWLDAVDILFNINATWED